MDAGEHDTKLFHKLVKMQCARPSTATEVIQYGSNTLAGTNEIASGFAAHFKHLATPSPNETFHDEYYRQVQYDALCLGHSRSL